jgi:hypothetical protein
MKKVTTLLLLLLLLTVGPQWQEDGYPCINAMAFYRLQQRMSLRDVLTELVDRQYTYGNLSDLLKENIHMVCMDTIVADESTLPPQPLTKRGIGRRKITRFPKRTRWSHNPI